MLRSVRYSLLLLFLLVGPAAAVSHQSAAMPACPEGWYPAVGSMGVDDGEAHWFRCSPFETWRTVLGASDDLVLVHETSPDLHQVIALDPEDGSEYWRKETARIWYAPGQFDSGGVVLLPVGDRESPALIGVEHKTGQELWRIDSGGVPLVHSATVTVIGEPGALTGPMPVRGIDRVTGEERWVSDVLLSDQSGASVGRSPVAMLGDSVVIPTGDTISALNFQTGARLWSAPHLSFLTAVDGVVIGVEGGDRPGAMVTALDINSGERLWTARGGASYGGFLALGDGVVTVLSANKREIIAYELASGNERWRVRPTLRVEPQVTHGTAVVALWEGELAVVSAIDGVTSWSATLPFGTPFMNSVGVNDTVIIVAINSLPWSD